ncbi:TetR/AcrR family transcriptional regulator [Aeromicrobium wangtongii]|uniref:TetR/AcrR family transcriptional regulator n=1 Tax=Aeromicrobium wangtongii TaxID=2969247 RepID=A0ABY5M843_9ACTN|nr:TetR/AcrR family transcriptional regulator [Aeromicrobium wangtongii]MCD9198851.1 TetR/AcrR family transcriptional regulator [Aeromicrobium wangtongii]MCL3819760.1 TetR/AcrR family transcriptional regulator [Aeromicrobium wangtongii]UUP13109.1 TetR/AcrR family transcriptional regulator [Aeromicrobium wangtongii]
MERKPGRPRALTVDAIAAAALDDGIATFSMPSVARRLGVAHSGLYRYVTDRDDLLVRALDQAFLSTTWPDTDQPWDDLLREIGMAVWRACGLHPGLDRASQMAPKPSPALLEKMDAWIAELHRQQFSMEDAAVAVEFIIAQALDSSSQMARLSRMDKSHVRREDIPVLEAYNNDEVWAGRGLYDRKVDIFLAGLSTRRTESV